VRLADIRVCIMVTHHQQIFQSLQDSTDGKMWILRTKIWILRSENADLEKTSSKRCDIWLSYEAMITSQYNNEVEIDVIAIS